MCRHLAYLGPRVPLSALLIEPEFSLLTQSWAPRDMRGGGTVNADGFGIGWYAGGRAVRYRRDCPMWTDSSLTALSRATVAGALLAAVRSGTVGMPVVETACAPFGDDTWLFSHNGVVAGWPDSLAGPASRLPPVDLFTVDAPTDSALLWVLLRHKLRAGRAPDRALAELVAEVTEAAPGSRLNFLLTDGRGVWATTVGHSLSLKHRGGVVLLASEPHDRCTDWTPVPDLHLVSADMSMYTVEALA
ncbi:ergothioneine biosynthesis protein EgtC [Phytomonospora sp. NPDC050363]|uniref:ergothioneine biosynthesis protein EgtC n=1 Tax=Phytomonospora sp. NPDC050363 TaxID=3155642 RepID=UPI0033D19ACD